MKRFLSLFLASLSLSALTLIAKADALVPPTTPIDKMGELGGPVLIILVLVVLPLALIIGVIALTIFLIKKLVKSLNKSELTLIIFQYLSASIYKI